MSNTTRNLLIVTGATEQLKELTTTIGGEFTFQTFKQLPNELPWDVSNKMQSILASMSDGGTIPFETIEEEATHYYDIVSAGIRKLFVQPKPLIHYYNDMLKLITPENKEVHKEVGATHIRNIDTHGAIDGFAWTTTNWGTRSDATNVHVIENTPNRYVIQFDTHLAPPSGIYGVLNKQFPTLQFMGCYGDEGYDNNENYGYDNEGYDNGIGYGSVGGMFSFKGDDVYRYKVSENTPTTHDYLQLVFDNEIDKLVDKHNILLAGFHAREVYTPDWNKPYKVIEFIQNMKEAYYMCQYISETDNPIVSKQIARKAYDYKRWFDTLWSTDNPNIDIKRDAQHIMEAYYTSRRLQEVVSQIYDECMEMDTPFYVEAGYGEFWDEVIVPYSVERVFEDLIEDLQKDPTNNCISLDEVTFGAVGISYYDLSHADILFRSRDDAERFADNNPVDGSEFIEFNGDYWVWG